MGVSFTRILPSSGPPPGRFAGDERSQGATASFRYTGLIPGRQYMVLVTEGFLSPAP